MTDIRKVLVLGSGAREHAIAMTLQRTSTQPSEVFFSPGNAGWPDRYRHTLDVMDFRAVLNIATALKIDLVVPGPEALLCAGIVDYFRERAPEVKVFGPNRAAAKLETYKAFMKSLCSAYGIKTAEHRIVLTRIEADRAVEEFGLPVVVKANGLCAGKGVVVAKTRKETDVAINEALCLHRFGDEGHVVIIERFIPGREVSAMRFCDGHRAVRMPTARDYKRRNNNDEGPNTGGMGAFAPVSDVENAPALLAKIDLVFDLLLMAMRREGSPFHGILYCGFMVSPEGELYLLECNVRFGDPETQAVLPLLDSDLAEIMLAGCVYGGLAFAKPHWQPGAAVGVTIANTGYPDSVEHLFELIPGMAEVMQNTNSFGMLFFGSLSRDHYGDYRVGPGRMATAVGLASTHDLARQRAYALAERIAPAHMRTDVAAGV